MNALNVYTNRIYNGKEIDNFKKAWRVSTISELLTAIDSFESHVVQGEILHIVDDWTYEDVTDKVLTIVSKYKALLNELDELEAMI